MASIKDNLLNTATIKTILLLVLAVILTGCVSGPPKRLDNICNIFDEKDNWYKHARKAEKRWGTSIAVNMAIMHQESRFRRKAKPPRTRILWVIPGPRKSSAYGYSQAKSDTWDWYIRNSGNRGADRDKYKDAIDFIGWYNSVSYRKNGTKKNDAYHLYLAYHEGHGGFNRRTYNKKAWLKGVAKKVSSRAQTYQRQLKSCEKRLQSSGWWFF